jgi:hypothetical protein
MRSKSTEVGIMGRTLSAICLVVLAGSALICASAHGDDTFLTLDLRTAIDEVDANDPDNPWAGDHAATRVKAVLDWNDPDGTANGTQFEIRRSLDGGATWEHIAYAYDNQGDGTEYNALIDPVFFPGDTDWATSFADGWAESAAVAPGVVGLYEVRVVPCDNEYGRR